MNVLKKMCAPYANTVVVAIAFLVCALNVVFIKEILRVDGERKLLSVLLVVQCLLVIIIAIANVVVLTSIQTEFSSIKLYSD
jgi:uncharacterized membrane protein YoaK (UPF0700 family)